MPASPGGVRVWLRESKGHVAEVAGPRRRVGGLTGEKSSQTGACLCALQTRRQVTGTAPTTKLHQGPSELKHK